MENVISSVVPATESNYLVVLQPFVVASYDRILAYRISSNGTKHRGSRVAILASGSEMELNGNFENRPTNYGIMDAQGRINASGYLYNNINEFSQAFHNAASKLSEKFNADPDTFSK